MNYLSTGQPSTLGDYLKMTKVVFGDDSGAAEFLRNEIKRSPHGESEEVVAEEREMFQVLAACHFKWEDR